MLSRSLTFLQRSTAANAGRKGPNAVPRIRAIVPTMQIYNVQPNPADGSLTRVTAEARGIRLAVLPQLGAPNTDPQDDTPQFDAARRAVSTFSPQEVGSLLAVLEGKIPTHTIESEFRSLTLAPDASGKSYNLTGFLKRATQDTVPVNVKLEKANLSAFKNFVESAIVEGFGFHQFLNPPQKIVIKRYNQELRELKREQEREDSMRARERGQSNGNRQNNNNRNNNNRDNSNNRDNNRNRDQNNNRNNNNNNNSNNNAKKNSTTTATASNKQE